MVRAVFEHVAPKTLKIISIIDSSKGNYKIHVKHVWFEVTTSKTAQTSNSLLDSGSLSPSAQSIMKTIPLTAGK